MMRIINSRIRNTQRPSSPYWISSQSARYISRWYSSNTNQREPNPDGCLRTIMAGNGSPRWVPNQSSSSIPVCEVRTTPLATVMSTKRFLCDGTRMEIEWRIIRGASSLEHRVYLDGEIETSIRTRPGVNSTTLTELKPRDKYNVQVLPLFMGCAGEYLPDGQVLTTGRGDLSPPTNLRLRYSPKQKSCIVTWDDEAIVDGELGYFNVSIRRERRSGEDSLSEATYERVDSGGRFVIGDPSPYSNYHVAVGSVTTTECMGRIQPAWTEVVAEGCLTPARGPDLVDLSTTGPTSDNDGVVLTLEPIDERNGPISCIAVVVQKEVEGASPRLITDIPFLQSGNRTEGTPYIAWVSRSFNDAVELRLGEGQVSCCDPDNLEPSLDCTPSSSLLRGENRDLDSQANYTYYVMTATPSDGEPVFAYSERSEVFFNNPDILRIDSEPLIEVDVFGPLVLHYVVRSTYQRVVRCELHRGRFQLKQEDLLQRGVFVYAVATVTEATYRLLCSVEVSGREFQETFRTIVLVIREQTSQKGDCEYFFSTERSTREEAEAVCREKQSVLAAMKTEEARAYAREQVNLIGLSGRRSMGYFIGARRGREGWRWEDASVVTSAPGGTGQCAVIRSSGAVRAEECESRNGFICEKTAPCGGGPCSSSPCRNRGSCVNVGCGFRCACADNFMGETCAIQILTVSTPTPSIQVFIRDNAQLVYDVSSTVPGDILCTLSRTVESGAVGSSYLINRFRRRISHTATHILANETFQLTCAILMSRRRITQASRVSVVAVRDLTYELGNCEYTFFLREVSFARAESVCSDDMSVLAVLKTQESRRFVAEVINRDSLRGPVPKNYFVGAQRRGIDWRWEDSSVVAPVPPNVGNCLAIQPSGVLTAVRCTSRFGGVCERIQLGRPYACSSSPCQHGGVCTDVGCGFRCRCTDNYVGHTCHIQVLKVSTPITSLRVITGNDAVLLYDVTAAIDVPITCAFEQTGVGQLAGGQFEINSTTLRIPRTIENIQRNASYQLTCRTESAGRMIVQSSQIEIAAFKVGAVCVYESRIMTFGESIDVDACVTCTCVNAQSGLRCTNEMTSCNVTCGDNEEREYVEGECCPICEPSCKPAVAYDRLRHGECVTNGDVMLTSCQGSCSSYVAIGMQSPFVQTSCNCCKPNVVEHRNITFNCVDGTSIERSVPHIQSCACANCEYDPFSGPRGQLPSQ